MARGLLVLSSISNMSDDARRLGGLSTFLIPKLSSPDQSSSYNSAWVRTGFFKTLLR